jgi:hypothetical protein
MTIVKAMNMESPAGGQFARPFANAIRGTSVASDEHI